MKEKDAIDHAGKQLDRVLGFFPRVESKISALFAVDAGMLGLLALNATANDFRTWYLALAYVATVTALGLSLFFLYRASYPVLKGGAMSLIYFREIAKRRETDYIRAIQELDETALLTDLLGQVWRNSEILIAKYDSLKCAFVTTAIAVPLWFAALLGASLHHATLLVK